MTTTEQKNLTPASLKPQRRKERKEIDEMKENEIGQIMVDASVKIHQSLGPGLLESVYEVILELKSVEQLNKVHHKQLLTYLKLTKIKLGFLLNFGAPLLKDGITRVVNGL